MKPSLQKLKKFLDLEVDRGYDNRAVMGGLDRMLGSWEAEARVDGIPEEVIQVISARLRDYNHLSPKSRAESLEGLWRRVQSDLGGSIPPLAVPKISQAGASGRREEAHTHKGKERPRTVPPARQEEPVPVLPEETEAAPQPESAEEQLAERSAGAASLSELVLPELPAAETPALTKPATRPAPTRPRRTPEGPPAAFNAPTTVLPGVGPAHAKTLSRLGMNTLGDMLYYFPRRYDDYTQLRPINRLFYGEEVTVIGTIQSYNVQVIKGRKLTIYEAVVSDGSGALRLTWYNRYDAKRLRPGLQVVLSGKIDQYLGRLVMKNPEFEMLEQQNLHTNRIVPVYPLGGDIKQRWLRRLMYQVVSYWAPRVQDPLPDAVRRSANLLDLPTAMQQIHFPDSEDLLKAARQRLAFDEIFLLQLGVLQQKRAWQNRAARGFEVSDDWLASQVQTLPFALTSAQQRALADVRHDLASGQPMNRLLQGDVGSGKTVVAALTAAMVSQTGSQTAFMAPTSILAEQHYRNLLRLLAGGDDPAQSVLRPEQIRLMVGATSEAEKEEIRQGLADGSIRVVIGTHALIEDPVAFVDLQLAIIDEQHRFGVEQRALLRNKGNNPHLLVMTATPIPRSLALTVYGDLDLSVMDEMPPGRQAVSTHVLFPRERERAYSLIKGQLEQGHQAFIIYPLVEENENTETPAAVQEQQRLQNEIFHKQRVGLLHGRMRLDEKDEVMQRFRDRQLDILVSTSVVEVGVDVPNATVMLIEGANRFGLAQLHQFRGRVGRGSDQAYCLLIPENPDEVENERLGVMSETNDGFVLAERDLDQRGPGDFLGTRQSGYANLKLASLTDVRLIEKARQHSQALFEGDPDLALPEHQLLANALRRFWGSEDQIAKGDIS